MMMPHAGIGVVSVMPALRFGARTARRKPFGKPFAAVLLAAGLTGVLAGPAAGTPRPLGRHALHATKTTQTPSLISAVRKSMAFDFGINGELTTGDLNLVRKHRERLLGVRKFPEGIRRLDIEEALAREQVRPDSRPDLVKALTDIRDNFHYLEDPTDADDRFCLDDVPYVVGKIDFPWYVRIVIPKPLSVVLVTEVLKDEFGVTCGQD